MSSGASTSRKEASPKGVTTSAVCTAGTAARAEPAPGEHGLSAAAWGTVFEAAAAALLRHSQAREGDRTMLDALLPAQRAYSGALQTGVPLITAT